MVNLTLTPHRGNGARTFPSAGYLGLTPVSLAGVVRVKIEEDMKPIQASSLVVRVRCYESVGSSATGGNNAGPSSSSSASTLSHSSNSASTSYGTTSSLNHPGSSAPSPTGTKGRVLYEQSLTMWLPPSPPTTSTSSTSTSTSSTCSTTSSPLSSRSSSLDRSSSSAIFHHAYPPRRESHQSLNHGQEITYGTLGEFTKPWRIVIPPSAVNEGAKSTMIFKNWKVWWAVEAGG